MRSIIQVIWCFYPVTVQAESSPSGFCFDYEDNNDDSAEEECCCSDKDF